MTGILEMFPVVYTNACRLHGTFTQDHTLHSVYAMSAIQSLSVIRIRCSEIHICLADPRVRSKGYEHESGNNITHYSEAW